MRNDLVYRDGATFKTAAIGKDAEVFAEQALNGYDDATQKAASTWSEPYIDTRAGNAQLITFSTPIFRGERIVGVVALDIDLTQLIERAGIPMDERTSVFVDSRAGKLAVPHIL